MKCPICDTQCKNGQCPACGYRADMGYHDTSREYWKENANRYALNDYIDPDSQNEEQSTEEYLENVYKKISENDDYEIKDSLAAEVFSNVFQKKQKTTADAENSMQNVSSQTVDTVCDTSAENHDPTNNFSSGYNQPPVYNQPQTSKESFDSPKKTENAGLMIFLVALIIFLPPAALIYMIHTKKPETLNTRRIFMTIASLATISWLASLF